MTIITLEHMAKAIANRVGIGMEEARRDANFVMDVFGFDDRVIDNVLDPEDRQLFYILEEEGMLRTEREETFLHNGREWHSHYWVLRKDMVIKYSDEKKLPEQNKLIPMSPKQINPNNPEEIYGSLGDDIWQRGQGQTSPGVFNHYG